MRSTAHGGIYIEFSMTEFYHIVMRGHWQQSLVKGQMKPSIASVLEAYQQLIEAGEGEDLELEGDFRSSFDKTILEHEDTLKKYQDSASIHYEDAEKLTTHLASKIGLEDPSTAVAARETGRSHSGWC